MDVSIVSSNDEVCCSPKQFDKSEKTRSAANIIQISNSTPKMLLIWPIMTYNASIILKCYTVPKVLKIMLA